MWYNVHKLSGLKQSTNCDQCKLSEIYIADEDYHPVLDDKLFHDIDSCIKL